MSWLVPLLAQTDGDAGVGIFDNRILDEWVLPFGAWVDQMVDWIDGELVWLLDAVKWPFSFLLTNVVNNIIAMSWVWVCLALFVVGSLVRNVKIGTMSALAMAGCGLLGTSYWMETARTVGMTLVAVSLCAIIGIPIGVLCGRFDSVWNAVRPTLDAMQVIHAFVYMLPIIFFFGLGVVPGTIVTMIFAIPPLIRLTNLGIRQVPEDEVEAARAFGAPELTVLFDVQLPRARPAIMTGLNQTLLLAISMIGIAAIMGANGLGLLVFRAVQNLNVSLAASAGLALFLVAVVLDRISQPESGDGGNLWNRIVNAWAHRLDPEALLVSSETPQGPSGGGTPAPIGRRERQLILGVVAGGIVAAASTLLVWTRDAGLFSGYARRSDESLIGGEFAGLDASGGSFFGGIVLVGAVFAIMAALWSLWRPGRGPRWFAADGALMASVSVTAVAAAHVFAAPSPFASGYSLGPGPIVALVGGGVASVAAGFWIRVGPYSALRPLSARVEHGRMTVGTIAIVLLGVAVLSGWSFDGRTDGALSVEVQAEIDDIRAQADRGEILTNIAAQEIQNLTNRVNRSGEIVLSGWSSDGPGLGWIVLILGAAGFGVLIPAAGFFGIDEHKQWRWSSISASLGCGIMAITSAYILTMLRVADSDFVSGAGAFLAFLAGFCMLVANRTILAEFRRSKVYDDDVEPFTVTTESEVEPAVG